MEETFETECHDLDNKLESEYCCEEKVQLFQYFLSL
jgi:hypothetical protein